MYRFAFLVLSVAHSLKSLAYLPRMVVPLAEREDMRPPEDSKSLADFRWEHSISVLAAVSVSAVAALERSSGLREQNFVLKEQSSIAKW